MTSRGVTTRRSMLGGLAALLPIAAAPAIAATSPTENPELIVLGRQFDAAESVFVQAKERKRAARAAYNSIATGLPDDLIRKGGEQHLFPNAYWERDIENENVWPASGQRRFVISRRDIDDLIPLHSARTKMGKMLRRKLAALDTYEKANEAAKEASGIDAAIEAEYLAIQEMDGLHTMIAHAECRTIEGVRIKARATVALCKVSEQHAMRATMTMGHPISEAVLSIIS